MRVKILTVIVLFLMPMVSRAQEEEFEQFVDNILHEIQNTDSTFHRNFHLFRDSIAKEFSNFRDSVNREFAKFLEQSWETFPIIPPTTPIRYNQVLSSRNQTISKIYSHETDEKNFFGIEIDIHFPENIPTETTEISEKSVGQIWLALGNSDFSTCLAECLLLSSHLNLNTWGYYQLISHITRQQPVSPDIRIIMQCFLMNHRGYKCRMGIINDRELVLLLPFNTKVYSFYHILINDIPYYIPEKKEFAVNKLKTYSREIKFATQTPDLFLHTPLKLGQNKFSRKEFIFNKKKIILPVNEHLIDFYATYPTCDLRVYASAPIDTTLLVPLREVLRKDSSGYTHTCEILRFMHACFKHQSDSIVWGRERYFFAEESLYYPYLDCEDSAILFRHLVNRLTGLEAILVIYPEHVAVAVDLPYRGMEKCVTHHDKKYMICEPSYIGALPGKQIPSMEETRELFCY